MSCQDVHSANGIIHVPSKCSVAETLQRCLGTSTLAATPVADDAAGGLSREAERRSFMTNKCAHPACSCPVSGKGMYCSAQCASGNPGNAMCGCKHPGCKATKTVDGQSS